MCVPSRHLSLRLHSSVMETAVVVVVAAAWACLLPVHAQSTVPRDFVLRPEHLLAREPEVLLRSGAGPPAPCTTPEGVNGVCGSVYTCGAYTALLDHLHDIKVLDFFRTRVCKVSPKHVHLCCPGATTPAPPVQSSSIFFFDTTPSQASPSEGFPSPSQRPNGRQPSVPRADASTEDRRSGALNPAPPRPAPLPPPAASESIAFPQESPAATTTTTPPPPPPPPPPSTGAFGGASRQPPVRSPFTPTTTRRPQIQNQPPTEPLEPPILPVEGECGKMAPGSAGNTPWAVGIGELDTRNFKVNCTGVLVSRLHVITAAHCVENASPRQVRLGNPQVREESVDVPLLTWVTPGYDPRTRENDLALITLATPVTFTDNIRPVCLPFRYRLDGFRGQELHVVGWSGMASLETGTVSILGFQECRDAYRAPAFIANNNVAPFSSPSASSFPVAADPRSSASVTVDRRNLCASPAPDGTSTATCLSDFGAPLIYHDEDETSLHFLAGVASLGNTCQAGPGLYTRLGAFLPWLSQQLSGVEVPPAGLAPTPAPAPTPSPTPSRRIQVVGLNFG